MKPLYSILKIASSVAEKYDNIGEYLRWAGEILKNFFYIASFGVYTSLKKNFWVPRPPRPLGTSAK